MIKRLFFYRIQVDRTRVPISQTVQGTVHVNLGAANAAITRRQHTPVGTDSAFDLIVF